MKPVIIFGAGTVARLAWRCFEEETPYSVAAFCVDDNRHNADTFCELPVLRSSELEARWPADACRMFVALGYQDLNRARQAAFEKYTALGYDLVSCISSKAVINGGTVGKNCFVMEGAILQPFSSVEDDCICWSGCIVSHESRIGKHCFLAAHSVVGGMADIGDNTFLSMNATVRDTVRVGKHCLVGAGSLVLADLDDDSLVAEKATPVAACKARQALRFIEI